MVKKILLFCVCIKSIWCSALEPYPTTNVTRYERHTFNCSVDSNWSSVSYYYRITNIAFFLPQDGKCKDFADHSLGRYTTYCDDTSRKFYLTINNVTDDYNEKIIQCQVVYSTGDISDLRSTITVQYAPITLPTITQTPNGSIHEGNKVTLTCVIQGGNPLAAITWSCDGSTQITPTGSPSLSEATSSVELVTSKDNNGQICTCIGKHILWKKDKAQEHTLSVYYQNIAPTVVFVVCKSTSATVLWNYESNRGSQHIFSVQYWNIQQPIQTMLSSSISDTSFGSKDNFRYTIEYLLPKTTYNFLVISRNEVGNSSSTSVNCTTDASTCISNLPEGNGLFVTGISSLVIGLLIAMFAVTFIIYFRFRQKKEHSNRSENYAEFKNYKPEEPHAYDVLSQPGTNQRNDEQRDSSVVTYEELPI